MSFSPLNAHKQDILEMRRRDILKLEAGAGGGFHGIDRESRNEGIDHRQFWRRCREGRSDRLRRASRQGHRDRGPRRRCIALAGKDKAMVESGKVVSDVCDADGFTSVQMGNAGLLEPIEYSVVDSRDATSAVA
ncbi:hypothetical protein ACFSQQ_23100 [Mesorhizobium kowhaii]|uniref:hypothetical protein n=1 Tax=Mesorhizobium kowhaii TaxID=1300272 RepID=UPI0035E7903E